MSWQHMSVFDVLISRSRCVSVSTPLTICAGGSPFPGRHRLPRRAAGGCSWAARERGAVQARCRRTWTLIPRVPHFPIAPQVRPMLPMLPRGWPPRDGGVRDTARQHPEQESKKVVRRCGRCPLGPGRPLHRGTRRTMVTSASQPDVIALPCSCLEGHEALSPGLLPHPRPALGVLQPQV